MFGESDGLFENIPHDHVPTARAPVGGSPDGLGAPPATIQSPGAPPMHAPMPGMHGEFAFFEPADTSPAAAVRTAGLTSLVVAIAFGSGLALGGGWGGVSGILLSGSAFNVYRAQKWWGSADPSEKGEAVVSALFGAVGLAAGGYSAYKAYQART